MYNFKNEFDLTITTGKAPGKSIPLGPGQTGRNGLFNGFFHPKAIIIVEIA
jgi:hypothetical protein